MSSNTANVAVSSRTSDALALVVLALSFCAIAAMNLISGGLPAQITY